MYRNKDVPLISFENNEQVVKQNVTGLLWIFPATSGWSEDSYLLSAHSLPYFSTSRQ